MARKSSLPKIKMSKEDIAIKTNRKGRSKTGRKPPSSPPKRK